MITHPVLCKIQLRICVLNDYNHGLGSLKLACSKLQQKDKASEACLPDNNLETPTKLR